ncbi:phosphohydrolase [Brumimicrobium sp.]|uniref:HD domain-containing protein n=1 Tax=Brumimicrobium sp. TaxID=2029867 RepID=UPI003A8CD0FC
MLNITSDEFIISKCFDEIIHAYESEGRYYHNLEHLKDLFSELERASHLIDDFNLVNIAVFYHDVIYNPTANNNEEKSAEFSSNHLKLMRASEQLIKTVYEAIIATKKHSESENNNINIFTDADLSILGTNSEHYKKYSQKIRYEYITYPSYLFDNGRIQALKQLMDTGRLFKSEYFYKLNEKQALDNLQAELDSLVKRNYKSERENGEYVQYLEWDGDLSEFFYKSVEILDHTKDVHKINYYPGWFDSGYYRFTYKGISLHLEYDGMLGTYLKTEPNSSQKERQVAEEIFDKLLEVRLEEKEINQLKSYLKKQLTKPKLH